MNFDLTLIDPCNSAVEGSVSDVANAFTDGFTLSDMTSTILRTTVETSST